MRGASKEKAVVSDEEVVVESKRGFGANSVEEVTSKSGKSKARLLSLRLLSPRCEVEGGGEKEAKTTSAAGWLSVLESSRCP
jgi:hypothetical protein